MRRAFIALFLAFAPIVSASPLRVSAAASLTDALQEIAGSYGAAIQFNFGASSALARQIEEGAPADVFISADEAKMDRLQQRGLIVKKSRRSILSNTLVIIVPSDSRLRMRSAKDLTGAAIRHIALGEPESVPAGIYAKEYLRKAGVWDAIASRIVPTDNVRSALAAVASGNADVGIVYRTDAMMSRSVRIAYEVSNGPAISYPAAIVADSSAKKSAQHFLDYLQSSAAKRVFRKYGFIVK